MKLFGKELKLTGKLTLLAGTSNEAPLNIPHGTAPTSPANGDVWSTTSSLYARINGSNRTIIHNGNATSLASDVSQAEAEAGTATTRRWWTALRIAQAIAAQAAAKVHTHAKADITDMPTKLSQLENDIGAGAGLNIVVSPTEPAGLSTGDWWYKEV